MTADDFSDDCPVSLDLLGRITRTDIGPALSFLDAVPEMTRARLAVWLYGRSHTHEIGIRVAATCSANALDRAAGPLGTLLHDLSRRPYAAPSHGTTRPNVRRISLAGRQPIVTAAA